MIIKKKLCILFNIKVIDQSIRKVEAEANQSIESMIKKEDILK